MDIQLATARAGERPDKYPPYEDRPGWDFRHRGKGWQEGPDVSLCARKMGTWDSRGGHGGHGDIQMI